MDQQKNNIAIKALHQDLAAIFTDENKIILVNKQGVRSDAQDLATVLDEENLSNLFSVTTTESTGSDRATDTDVEAQELIIYTDGGSRGNPGPSASGYVIMDAEENILEEGGEYLGITTNNQAEYQAVRTALKEAGKFQPKVIKFRIDSLLVVNQMIGKYKIRNRDLWPIHSAIKTLIKDFEKVTFTHVRREFNKLADQKVNEVLDARKD